ncbi:MAG: DNRLRE domain-containing protein [Crocinitomicaceae bacterium]
MKKIICILTCSLLSLPSISQKDSCIVKTSRTDAMIIGRTNVVHVNYGEHLDLLVSAWTNNGDFTPCRSLIKFDFDIPAQAIITSAELSLFHIQSQSNHPEQTGNNAAYIKRVTSPWEEDLLTWANKPTTTDVNRVNTAATTSVDQDFIDIDVTALIQDIHQSGVNYGIQLELQVEEIYSNLIFASSDNPNTNIHPTINICYSLPSATTELEILEFDIYPNPTSSEFSLRGEGLRNVKVYDIAGKLIFESPLYETNTLLSVQATQGVYQVLVTDSEGRQAIKKLVIQ